MKDQRRRTQVERRDEAEIRMLEAGVRLAAVGGLDDFTLAEVGISAGYSRGLPRHHFGSKETFRAALFRFVVEVYSAGLEPPREPYGLSTLVSMMKAFLDRAREDAVFLSATKIIISQNENSVRLSPEIHELREQQKSEIERQLREGVRKGEIRHDIDPQAVCLVIIAAASGVLELAFLDTPMDIRGPSDEFINVILHGLASDGPKKVVV